MRAYIRAYARICVYAYTHTIYTCIYARVYAYYIYIYMHGYMPVYTYYIRIRTIIIWIWIIVILFFSYKCIYNKWTMVLIYRTLYTIVSLPNHLNTSPITQRYSMYIEYYIEYMYRQLHYLEYYLTLNMHMNQFLEMDITSEYKHFKVNNNQNYPANDYFINTFMII